MNRSKTKAMQRMLQADSSFNGFNRTLNALLYVFPEVSRHGGTAVFSTVVLATLSLGAWWGRDMLGVAGSLVIAALAAGKLFTMAVLHLRTGWLHIDRTDAMFVFPGVVDFLREVYSPPRDSQSLGYVRRELQRWVVRDLRNVVLAHALVFAFWFCVLLMGLSLSIYYLDFLFRLSALHWGETYAGRPAPVVDYFYYVAVTVSTLGYGDVRPDNVIGRIQAVVLVITWFFVVSLALSMFLSTVQQFPRQILQYVSRYHHNLHEFMVSEKDLYQQNLYHDPLGLARRFWGCALACVSVMVLGAIVFHRGVSRLPAPYGLPPFMFHLIFLTVLLFVVVVGFAFTCGEASTPPYPEEANDSDTSRGHVTLRSDRSPDQ